MGIMGLAKTVGRTAIPAAVALLVVQGGAANAAKTIDLTAIDGYPPKAS